MMNGYRNYLYGLILVILICSCCARNKPSMQENQVHQEFCFLGISHFDSLLKNIENVFYRSGGYAVGVKEGGFILLKSGTDFFYKRLSSTQDTLIYDLDINRKILEQQYSIEIEKTKKLIEFCYEWNIVEIKIDKEKHYYSFYFPDGVIYYRESTPLRYDEKICENWYLSRPEIGLRKSKTKK